MTFGGCLHFQRIPKSQIMRTLSRKDGGPRKSSVAMEQPATTNSTTTKGTATSTAEMKAVPQLHALLYRQWDEMATEQSAVKALQWAIATPTKAVREEEAMKCRNLLSDSKSRYGSYYSAPLACFWLALPVLCLLFRLVSNRKKCCCFIGQTDRTCNVKWSDLCANGKTLSHSGAGMGI